MSDVVGFLKAFAATLYTIISDVVGFLMTFGVMLHPMVLLAVVVLILIAVAVVRLLLGRADRKVRSGIDAILFWGVVTSLLGFLGQWVGLYKVTQVLIRVAPRVGVNPQAVGIGFAESLRTSIFRVVVLLFAAVVWFVLQTWWRRLAERSRLSPTARSAE